ncbi:succinate dehydrogenase iron-sulfur subunit [Stieleria maiorica]|uniref:Succinate dehydrogenase iron-sulfur subunit n=1 Tax=Stieleria maiorica TaxID=2795974 RepID=A0A5B9MDU4_9BACT|nr:hypothetical protein [Stieleria maiorica]QEF97774.1 succinate dehydrogenase iron-sulfur subunit [Stieleria maiorica]
MQVDTFRVRVERRDQPSGPSYWQSFELAYRPGMNVTSVLQLICANPITIDDQKLPPIGYESG